MQQRSKKCHVVVLIYIYDTYIYVFIIFVCFFDFRRIHRKCMVSGQILYLYYILCNCCCEITACEGPVSGGCLALNVWPWKLGPEVMAQEAWPWRLSWRLCPGDLHLSFGPGGLARPPELGF